MANLYLVAGLGNPGREYAATRHNAGFMVVAALAERWGGSWRDESRFQSRLSVIERQGDRVWLCQPQTFMNASGEAVRAVMDFYRVPVERLMVVVDDADLPLGQLRLRPQGSSGGHHGLDSVQRHLGTNGFARQKVGVSPELRPDGRREISNFVLGRFADADAPVLGMVLQRAGDQIECWRQQGVQTAMNNFNGACRPAEELKRR